MTGRLDPVLAPEHVDELPAEARPADAVEQEVEGVVRVCKQVEDDPHDAQFAVRRRCRILTQRVRHDEVDGDGRRRHEEGERDRDEDRRHRRHLDGVAVRVQARATQVVRIEHAQQDGYVASDEHDEWQHAEGDEVDPRPHGAHEVGVLGVEWHAVGDVLVGVLDANVLVGPEEVGVKAADGDGADSQRRGGGRPSAEALGLVREEDGDQPLDGDNH